MKGRVMYGEHRYFSMFLAVLMCFLAMPSATSSAQEVATPAPEDQSPQPSIDFYPADKDQPGYINVELSPGESTRVNVVLGNNGEVDFEAVTYAADAITIRNGGFGLKELDDDKTGVTTWLDYPTEHFQTDAGESVQREFTITVPAGTPSGEYVTGIAMQTADPVNDEVTEGMFRFDQYYRTVIGIRILVPGQLAPDLEIGQPAFVFDGTIPAIVIPVTNVGNQQTSPSGNLRVVDASGEVIITAPVQMGRVYAGHETELWFGLSQPLPAGEYQVSVLLEDKEKNMKAELLPTELTVAPTDIAAGETELPISMTAVNLVPMPDKDNVQFLLVEATIQNVGDPISEAQLTLIVTRDGEVVERFAVNQSLSLPAGDTQVSSRYLPIEGWSSGTWEFELVVEVVEGSGATVVVATEKLGEPLQIP